MCSTGSQVRLRPPAPLGFCEVTQPLNTPQARAVVLSWNSFVSRRYLAMPRDIFHPYSWRGSITALYWVEAKDAAKHPTMSMTVPSNTEITGPKCQDC